MPVQRGILGNAEAEQQVSCCQPVHVLWKLLDANLSACVVQCALQTIKHASYLFMYTSGLSMLQTVARANMLCMCLSELSDITCW